MKKNKKEIIFPAGLDKVGFIEAQGLPWETRSNVTSPEGASGISGRGSSALVSGRPFRASGDKRKTQG